MAERTLVDVIADAAFEARNGTERDLERAIIRATREWLTSDAVVLSLTQRMLDNFATEYPVPPNRSLDAEHPHWAHVRGMAREAQQMLADAIEAGVTAR